MLLSTGSTSSSPNMSGAGPCLHICVSYSSLPLSFSLSFSFSLPLSAFLLLSSSQVCYFLLGLIVMGMAHAVITVKGTHLASHGALSESGAWRQFWAVFFIEVRQLLLSLYCLKGEGFN